jgi:hypothetical protein
MATNIVGGINIYRYTRGPNRLKMKGIIYPIQFNFHLTIT